MFKMSGYRYDKDGEEAFFYVRGTTRRMVSFKDCNVKSFFVTQKGDAMATEVYSVAGY